MSNNETAAFQGAQPPPGVTPNFVNPDNAAWGVIPAGWTLISICIILITIRFVAKFRYKQAPPLMIDDYLCLTAVLFGLVRVIMVHIIIVNWGIGRHQWDVPYANFTQMWHLFDIEDMIYCLGILCAKLSILCFYLTLFKINKWFKIATWATMGLSIAYLLGSFATYVFHCGVNTWKGSTACLNGVQQETAIGAFSIATDFIILILPLPMVWNLHLKTSKKVALSFVFGLGVMVLAASITREVYTVTTLGFADQTWNTSDVVIWKTIEMLVGILCANLLTGPFVLRWILQTKAGQSLVRLFTSRSNRRSDAKPAQNDVWNHNNHTDTKLVKSITRNGSAAQNSVELSDLDRVHGQV